MTSNNYHIQKESQAKALKVINETVQANSFSKKIKKEVDSLVAAASAEINAMRAEVFAELDSFEFPEYEHEVDANFSNALYPKVKDDTNALIHTLQAMVAEIEGQILRETNDSITGTSYNKFFKTEDFLDQQQNVLAEVRDIRKALLVEDITNSEKEIVAEEVKVEEPAREVDYVGKTAEAEKEVKDIKEPSLSELAKDIAAKEEAVFEAELAKEDAAIKKSLLERVKDVVKKK